MAVPNKSYISVCVAGLGVLCLWPGADLSRGEEFRLESVGARGGFSANQGWRQFYQAEAFGNWTTPWSWDLGKEWSLQSRLDVSVGWMSNVGDDAVFGTLGPSLVLRRERLPLSLEAGSSPTLLSQHNFIQTDLGTVMQFTAHVGLEWRFAEHWSVGYRFSHMSNAHLSSHNPGLNMHLFGLTYHF